MKALHQEVSCMLKVALHEFPMDTEYIEQENLDGSKG